ncbi:Mo25-like protein [Dioscorea alata]|uniref:Mo25-like protein n=1 Tax=Dioscorea alata TaxID=55571 RepID=A0ACB7V139_DIOAL|nr:Mo25-like protein [Dioscorea alata]
MSFSFFRPASRSPQWSPLELVYAIREGLRALDTETGAKALEEVEKNILSMKQLLSGNGEAELDPNQVSQVAVEVCKDDLLSLFVLKLPTLGWQARKDLGHCWCILLSQKVGSSYCCVDYIENHVELLDFLIVW